MMWLEKKRCAIELMREKIRYGDTTGLMLERLESCEDPVVWSVMCDYLEAIPANDHLTCNEVVGNIFEYLDNEGYRDPEYYGWMYVITFSLMVFLTVSYAVMLLLGE